MGIGVGVCPFPCSARLRARLPPLVRQDPMLGGSETFNSFLRKAQQVRGQELLAVVGCEAACVGVSAGAGRCLLGPLGCRAV